MLSRDRLWKLPDCYLLSSPMFLALVLPAVFDRFGVPCPYWANSAHQTRYRELLCCISSFWPLPQYEHSLSIDQSTLLRFWSKSGRTSSAIGIIKCEYAFDPGYWYPFVFFFLILMCFLETNYESSWFSFAFHLRLVMPSLALSPDANSPRSYYKMKFWCTVSHGANSSAHYTCQF